MSDADNQMGGSGSPPETKTGAEGEEAESSGKAAGDGGTAGEKDQVTEESEESFPASDPPANY